MAEGKTPISQAETITQVGEFWDNHDLADFWDASVGVDFEVDARSSTTYYPLERELASRLRVLAERRGISAEDLLNIWVEEKAREEAAAAP